MVRATSTVLFTDIVGSTELAVALGPAFDDVRRSHDALLRAAVDAARGRFVKGTGDGVLATFTTVTDGVACARAMQEAIHRLRRRRPDAALAIRVGLAVGDVSFEDGDCYGETVVQAARLCTLAEGDQILATAAVRALAGGARAEGFAEVGPLVLKGLPDPVDTVEITWERPAASATPLPAHLDVELASFVGRSPELARLHEAYTAVSDGGHRQVVLVGGEPGIGKTSMVSLAARRWFDAGATVAMGRCEEDVRAPYRPFVDVLGHLVASAPDDVLHAHVARHGPRLAPLAPRLAERVGPLPEVGASDPETERHQLFAAAADLLAAIGEVTPVVVVLDDLHWADAGTVSLLQRLATAAEPARLLIAGTFRSDELAGDHPMGQALAAFRRVASVSRVELGGLARGDVLELVERWVGSDVGPNAEQLADDLVAETDGNAFFVTEVVRHLDETGQLSDLADRAPSRRTLLPDSIREVLGERVARLGTVGDTVLTTAAVIGSDFTLPLLSAVTGLDDGKLLDVLDAATAAALVREVGDQPGRFTFTHALVQHAVLANLGATRESALHRRVAEVLEADHDGTLPVAELAHHWLQATNVSDRHRAMDFARQAGEAALAALAPADAMVYFRQALLLHDQLRTDDEPTRVDLLTQLGTAERQAGDPEHRETLLRAGRLAGRLGDGPRLAAAALANHSGTFSTFQGVDEERLAMLEAAIAAGAAPAQQALLLGTLANELTYAGDFDRRRAVADEALRTARASGDPAVLLRVSNLVFYALWVPETLGERLAMTEESLRLLDGVGDPLLRYWVASSGFLNLVQAGRVTEADQQLHDVDVLAERLAQPALLWRVRHTQATRLLLAGDPDAAAPLAEAARDLGRQAGELAADVYFQSQATAIRWQQGTLGELAARIKGTSPRPPNAMATLCLVFAEGGREDEAAAILDHVAATDLAELPHDPAFLTCAALFAEGAIRLGHTAAAAVLHRHLVPFADQVGFDGVLTVGSLAHHVGGLAGVLGRADEAVAALTRSIELHDAIGARFFADRSRAALRS